MLCFGIDLFLAQPEWGAIIRGFLPTYELWRNPDMLYLAVGVIGATVMPHNLYLHSAVVQTRKYDNNLSSIQEAIKFTTIDTIIALSLAFCINAAILIVSAAVFNTRGMHTIAELQDAYQMLTPLLGTSIASLVFALALLISGQNSTITGTLAGQIVMEGFINLQIRPWARRIISRSMAILPAVLSIILLGTGSLARLLLLSQVILSFQLPFAIFPLIQFTSNNTLMGQFANNFITKLVAYSIGLLILIVNIWLIYHLIF